MRAQLWSRGAQEGVGPLHKGRHCPQQYSRNLLAAAGAAEEPGTGGVACKAETKAEAEDVGPQPRKGDDTSGGVFSKYVFVKEVCQSMKWSKCYPGNLTASAQNISGVPALQIYVQD